MRFASLNFDVNFSQLCLIMIYYVISLHIRNYCHEERMTCKVDESH